LTADDSNLARNQSRDVQRKSKGQRLAEQRLEKELEKKREEDEQKARAAAEDAIWREKLGSLAELPEELRDEVWRKKRAIALLRGATGDVAEATELMDGGRVSWRPFDLRPPADLEVATSLQRRDDVLEKKPDLMPEFWKLHEQLKDEYIALGGAVGALMRGPFSKHVTSQLELQRYGPSGLQSAETEADDIIATPVLRPIVNFLVRAARPTSLRVQELMDLPRRMLQSVAFQIDMLRRVNDLKVVGGLVQGHTDSLAGLISLPRQNELARSYGTTTSAAASGDRRRLALQVNEELSFDAAADAVLLGNDNFGRERQSHWERQETTTSWNRHLFLTPEQRERRATYGAEWSDMSVAGIETENDMLAGPFDDAVLRYGQLLYFQAVDEAPELTPVAAEAADEPNFQRKRRRRLAARDESTKIAAKLLSDLGVDESALGAHQSNGAEAETEDDDAFGSFANQPHPQSVWVRNCIVLARQLVGNFAESKVVIDELVNFLRRAKETYGEGDSILRPTKRRLFYGADGAPVAVLQKNQRVLVKLALDNALSGLKPFPDTAKLDAGFEIGDDDGQEHAPEDRLGGEAPRPAMRDNVSELSADAVAALLGTYILLGLWHCMQSAMRSVMKCSSSLTVLARLYRHTEGRVNWLFRCGKLRESMGEIESILFAFYKFALETWREDVHADHSSYAAFDKYLDTGPFATCAALRVLREIGELMAIPRCIRVGMRGGHLPFLVSFLKQLKELCAVTGGDKYTRGITHFLVMLRTMPEADLALVCQLMFVDVGISGFVAVDEFTELIHLLYNRALPQFTSTANFVKWLGHLSLTMASSRIGYAVGAKKTSAKPPFGAIEIDLRIAAKARRFFRGNLLIRKDEAGSPVWYDPTGREWSCDDSSDDVGTRAEADLASGRTFVLLDGGAGTAVAVDAQRGGRAIAAEDDRKSLLPTEEVPCRRRNFASSPSPRPLSRGGCHQGRGDGAATAVGGQRARARGGLHRNGDDPHPRGLQRGDRRGGDRIARAFRSAPDQRARHAAA